MAPVATPVALPSPQAGNKREAREVNINSSNSLIIHEENTKEINV